MMVLSFCLHAQQAIVGTWLIEDGMGKVQIFEQQGKFYGKIVWLKKATDEYGKPLLDKENPNPSLRSRTVQGLSMLSNFTYNGKGMWENGYIYDPKTGKTYNCTLWMEGNTLKVRGSVGMLYDTQTWTKS